MPVCHEVQLRSAEASELLRASNIDNSSYEGRTSRTRSPQNMPSKMGKLYISQKNPFATI